MGCYVIAQKERLGSRAVVTSACRCYSSERGGQRWRFWTQVTGVQTAALHSLPPALRAQLCCQYFLSALLWLVCSGLLIGFCETRWFLAGVLLNRADLGAPWLSNPWRCFPVCSSAGQICVSRLKFNDCLLPLSVYVTSVTLTQRYSNECCFSGKSGLFKLSQCEESYRGAGDMTWILSQSVWQWVWALGSPTDLISNPSHTTHWLWDLEQALNFSDLQS